jgi:hypothetical protein
MLNLKRIFTLAVAMLGLLSVFVVTASAASAEKARSYEFSVTSATKVGTQVLTPGDYKVKLDGSNAVFTKEGTKATFTAPAKLEAGSEKFDRTILHVVEDSGQPRIISVELKGGKDLLKLN